MSLLSLLGVEVTRVQENIYLIFDLAGLRKTKCKRTTLARSLYW